MYGPKLPLELHRSSTSLSGWLSRSTTEIPLSVSMANIHDIDLGEEAGGRRSDVRGEGGIARETSQEPWHYRRGSAAEPYISGPMPMSILEDREMLPDHPTGVPSPRRHSEATVVTSPKVRNLREGHHYIQRVDECRESCLSNGRLGSSCQSLGASTSALLASRGNLSYAGGTGGCTGGCTVGGGTPGCTGGATAGAGVRARLAASRTNLNPSPMGSHGSVDVGMNAPASPVTKRRYPRESLASITSVATTATYESQEEFCDAVRDKFVEMKSMIRVMGLGLAVLSILTVVGITLTALKWRSSVLNKEERQEMGQITYGTDQAPQQQTAFRPKHVSFANLFLDKRKEDGKTCFIQPLTLGTYISEDIKQVDNTTLKISEEGYYLVYSQVVFHTQDRKSRDPTTHSICRKHLADTRNNREVEILKHRKTLIGSDTVHTSYLSAIRYLKQSDEIYVKISHIKLIHNSDRDHNYFGLYKLFDVEKT